MPFEDDKKIDEIYERRCRLVEESVELHHTRLLYYAYALTKNWHDAENIMQRLWTYVLLRMEEHNIKRESVLFDKTKKLVLDHYRANQRRPFGHADEFEENLFFAKQSQEVCDDEEELRFKNSFFAEYLDCGLTEPQKDVLWLHARYGFTYAEISERVGVAVSTIGDWIVTGRKKIAEELNRVKGNA